jgi:signal peptidase II
MRFFEKKSLFSKNRTMPFWGGISMAAITAAVYILDRVSKYLVIAKMSPGESFPVADGIFHITFVHNTGGAFGIMREHPYVFVASAVIFTVFAVLYVNFRWNSMVLRDKVALCLIVGGTLGNLSDRLKLGYVIDFLDFRVWPVFNLADSCITIGAAILVFSVLFLSGEKEKNA